MGRVKIATSELRTCIKNRIITIATIILSSTKVLFRLSIAAPINSERSYEVTISTSSGNEDFKSDKIYDFSFDEEDKVVVFGDTLYYDDKYIKLK